MSRLINGDSSSINEIRQTSLEDTEDQEIIAKGNFESVVSTGSTLLDLTISGTRIRGGGIPSGILVEIFGPSGHGKTTLLGEIGASAQRKGGFFILGDAEHRITRHYARIMGIKVTEENYKTPDTVKECMDLILNTPETGNGVIDVTGIDSIAVLLSEMDQSEDGDKRGSARAKELHRLVRYTKSEIAKKTRLVVFTNQIQDVQSETGMPSFGGPKEKTPGGHAVPFMASLRIRVGPSPEKKLIQEVSMAGKKIEQSIGIVSRCKVIKSTVDKPFRETDIYIIYDYGIDDIRANLRFLKKYTGDAVYAIGDERLGQSIDTAMDLIERNNMENDLREATINLWEEIQEKFKQNRKPKERI